MEGSEGHAAYSNTGGQMRLDSNLYAKMKQIIETQKI